jgi:hypothetical protein
MKRLEEAARRLEAAVARLESAASRPGGNAAEMRRLAAALAEAQADNGAHEGTTAQVVTRLDAAISRLNAALGH